MLYSDAELPAPSPDGRFLVYVTSSQRCTQDGVALVALSASRAPEGQPQFYRSPTVPPVLPITSVAVASGGTEVAVAGGALGRYRRPTTPTTFTLDVVAARSLDMAQPLGDDQGSSIPPPPGQTASPPTWWWSAPAYEPDSSLVLAMNSQNVSVMDSGGFEYLLTGIGSVRSIGFGPNSDLAFVDGAGSLKMGRAMRRSRSARSPNG